MAKHGLNLNPGEKTILCIGAHPDDCEFSCSGTAVAWAESGNTIVFVSVTDGRSGHHVMSGEEIAARRKVEAARAAAVIGAESRVLKFHDGFLEPSLANRLEVIRVIREIMPDVIVTNRLNDYHPDHRYASQLIQDSAYMLMVPHVLPETEALQYNPVILYWADTFTYPRPFRADAVVNIDPFLERKLRMLGCHESQMYEWLPFITKYPIPVPEDAEGRGTWLRKFYEDWPKSAMADICRGQLCDRYGEAEGNAVKHAEAYELCEYGTALDSAGIKALFQDTYSGVL